MTNLVHQLQPAQLPKVIDQVGCPEVLGVVGLGQRLRFSPWASQNLVMIRVIRQVGSPQVLLGMLLRKGQAAPASQITGNSQIAAR